MFFFGTPLVFEFLYLFSAAYRDFRELSLLIFLNQTEAFFGVIAPIAGSVGQMETYVYSL